METGKCTIGIPSESVKQAGGLLPFLLDSGVRVLERIDASWGVFKPITKNPTIRTKYTNIRNRFNKQIDVHESNVDLADLIDDLIVHGIPLDRRIAKVIFKDPMNGNHTYTLRRRGNRYIVRKIDNLDVYGEFNPNKISEIYKGSYFEKIGGLRCNIHRKPAAKWDFFCVEDQWEEAKR